MSLAGLVEGGRVGRALPRIFSEEARAVRRSVDNGGCAQPPWDETPCTRDL